MMGILPFLIQWLAITYLGNQFGQQQGMQNYQQGYSFPPKSHWALLSEFQNLPEEEIETFLPQICNMILDRDALNDPAIFDYFERIMLSKCAQCLPFGMRVCGILRAASNQASQEGNTGGGGAIGGIRNLFSSYSVTQQQQQRKQEILRRFHERAEYATCFGENLPKMVQDLRNEYFHDFHFLLDNLGRLGVELKSFPVHQRNVHLKRALNGCNALLTWRMLSQQSFSSAKSSMEDFYAYRDISLQQIAALCPAAACFSLHLPLQHSKEKVLRILRFVETECEILPSKDRCPYLVVVELLEQPFPCTSDELYTEGRRFEISSQDVLTGRGSYQNPQVMPTMTTPLPASSTPIQQQQRQQQQQQQQQQQMMELDANGLLFPNSTSTTSSSSSSPVINNNHHVHSFARLSPPSPSLSSSSSAIRSIELDTAEDHLLQDTADRIHDHLLYHNHHQQQQQREQYYYTPDDPLSVRGGSLLGTNHEAEAAGGVNHHDHHHMNHLLVGDDDQEQEEQSYEDKEHDLLAARFLQQLQQEKKDGEEEKEKMDLLITKAMSKGDRIAASYDRIASYDSRINHHDNYSNNNSQLYNSLRREEEEEIHLIEEEEEQPAKHDEQQPQQEHLLQDSVGSSSAAEQAARKQKQPAPGLSTPIRRSAGRMMRANTFLLRQQQQRYQQRLLQEQQEQLEQQQRLAILEQQRQQQAYGSSFNGQQQQQQRTGNGFADTPYGHQSLPYQPLAAVPEMRYVGSQPVDSIYPPSYHLGSASSYPPSPSHLTPYHAAATTASSTSTATATAATIHDELQQQQQQQQLIYYRGIVRPKTWEEKKAMVKSLSPFGKLDGWTLRSFIVKSGDDLRKEVLAMQIIEYMQQIFQQEGLGEDIYLRPYQILSTGYQSGLVEFLEGAMSIDRIKKLKTDRSMTLPQYFTLHFGDSYSFLYGRAIQNFVKSLVGYSLVTYIVQVRDRHNANLLIDPEGHIVHIDFGFIFRDSPGFNMNFESAPFKFTKEYLDLIGGPDSPHMQVFQDLFVRGFKALQKHVDGIAAIVQLFYGGSATNMEARKKNVVQELKARLLFPEHEQDIMQLISDSFDNWRTKQYDWFQQQSNNIQM